MMTNAHLQKMITDYGDRIATIQFNNGKHMYLGYKSGTQLSDLSLVTIEGQDYIIVHRKEEAMNIGRTLPIEYDLYYVTDFIEAVGIMSEGSEEYRPDPRILK